MLFIQLLVGIYTALTSRKTSCLIRDICLVCLLKSADRRVAELTKTYLV